MATEADIKRAQAGLSVTTPEDVVEALKKTGMLEGDAVFAVQAAMILNKDEEEEEENNK